jgi:deoxyribodipyrimidine photo-lyase
VKQAVNIVWLKRDLRLTDHQPLFNASLSPLPVILLYVFEPSLINAPDGDIRHWRFVWQSLMDIEQKLNHLNQHLTITYGEVIPVLEELQKEFKIVNIYAHQEIGVKITFDRDKAVASFCKQHHVKFTEFQRDAIQRGRKNREQWDEQRLSYLQEPISVINWNRIKTIEAAKINARNLIPEEIKHSHPDFQIGGSTEARKLLDSFLNERIYQYMKQISKPKQSRTGCSRLSPYLAWGNISMREVIHAIANHPVKNNKRMVSFWMSRLQWHCHFIQKFETACEVENQNLNKAFDDVRTEWNQTYFEAWCEGKTGYPLVDACMRCVKRTGYINFRMRAMLVSFLTHNLWLDWKKGAVFLAKQFLDYEPCIHYPQFQMQAGTMGVHIIRTYNPIKQSIDHDPDGAFIKEWIPELSLVPTPALFQPWLMTEIEQKMYKCVIGKDYPFPIVDLKLSANHASTHLWAVKKTKIAKEEGQLILNKLSSRKNDQALLPKTKRSTKNEKQDLNFKLF